MIKFKYELVCDGCGKKIKEGINTVPEFCAENGWKIVDDRLNYSEEYLIYHYCPQCK